MPGDAKLGEFFFQITAPTEDAERDMDRATDRVEQKQRQHLDRSGADRRKFDKEAADHARRMHEQSAERIAHLRQQAAKYQSPEFRRDYNADRVLGLQKERWQFRAEQTPEGQRIWEQQSAFDLERRRTMFAREQSPAGRSIAEQERAFEGQKERAKLQERFEYARSDPGQAALRAEHDLRKKLTDAERIATGETTKLGVAFKSMTEPLAAFGMRLTPMAHLFFGASAAGTAYTAAREKMRTTAESDVALSNPNLSYRLERAKADYAATIGRGEEKDVREQIERRKLFADAEVGRERNWLGKFAHATGIEYLMQEYLPTPSWVKERAEANRKAGRTAEGTAYNPALGQKYDIADFWSQMAGESLRMPEDKEATDATRENTEAIKALNERLGGWREPLPAVPAHVDNFKPPA